MYGGAPTASMPYAGLALPSSGGTPPPPSTGSLFRVANLALGAGGPFFSNPLNSMLLFIWIFG